MWRAHTWLTARGKTDTLRLKRKCVDIAYKISQNTTFWLFCLIYDILFCGSHIWIDIIKKHNHIKYVMIVYTENPETFVCCFMNELLNCEHFFRDIFSQELSQVFSIPALSLENVHNRVLKRLSTDLGPWLPGHSMDWSMVNMDLLGLTSQNISHIVRISTGRYCVELAQD